MKSDSASTHRAIFILLLVVGVVNGCMAEKKVASGVQATDTLAGRTATNVVASSTGSGNLAPKPDSGATIQFDQEFDVQLVDSTDNEDYYFYRVQVTFAGRVDTIPGVRTFDLPVVTSDSVLHGAYYEMDGPGSGIYAYNPRTHAVSNTPLPRDAAGWDNRAMISPDAIHIAYVSQDSTGSQGIVRSWPAGAVVLATMKAPQAPSDYSFNQVWWVNRDSVEFLWHTDLGVDTKASDSRFPFLALYVQLPARRITVDTLEKAPNFRVDAEK